MVVHQIRNRFLLNLLTIHRFRMWRICPSYAISLKNPNVAELLCFYTLSKLAELWSDLVVTEETLGEEHYLDNKGFLGFGGISMLLVSLSSLKLIAISGSDLWTLHWPLSSLSSFLCCSSQVCRVVCRNEKKQSKWLWITGNFLLTW